MKKAFQIHGIVITISVIITALTFGFFLLQHFVTKDLDSFLTFN